MSKRTAGVELLVQEVLNSIPRPYSEDIIDEVCLAIESNPKWRQRYIELSDELRDWVVNNWIGQYVVQIVGRQSSGQVPSRNGLMSSYSKLPP